MAKPASNPSPGTQSLHSPFTIQAYAADGCSLPLGFDDSEGLRLGFSSPFMLTAGALEYKHKYVRIDPAEIFPPFITLSQWHPDLLFETVKENEHDKDPCILRVAKPSGTHHRTFGSVQANTNSLRNLGFSMVAWGNFEKGTTITAIQDPGPDNGIGQGE